jgi:ATP-binding cassette subfamily G (WHITE) protein 2 (SNQ2)
MYHPFIEAFAMTLADIPITIVTLTVYSIVLYFMVGLQASAGQFLCIISIRPLSALTDPSYSVFYLLIITISLVMKAYFRTIAAVFADPAPAQAVAGVSLLILVLYTGYSIPVQSMIGALRWLIWINVGSLSYHRNSILFTSYT